MKSLYVLLTLAMSVLSFTLYAQDDSELLNLPGDNLDLYVVLDLFQESPSIEDFESDLNNPEKSINNLDLTEDGNIDFIKVVTQQNDDDFIFILQVDVTENEIQDVAVIFVSKDTSGKVGLQIVGDEALYGKDYVIEPAPTVATVTPNPAYVGPDVVQSGNTVVVVESAPIVKYVYSPVYVPYYPHYYYGYYPPYYRPVPVVTVHFYYNHHRRYHTTHNHYYHGGRGGNTVIINKNYSNYNKTRHSSAVVLRSTSHGKYANGRSTTVVKRSTVPVRRTTTTTTTVKTTKTTNNNSRSTRSTPQTSTRSSNSIVSSRTSTTGTSRQSTSVTPTTSTRKSTTSSRSTSQSIPTTRQSTTVKSTRQSSTPTTSQTRTSTAAKATTSSRKASTTITTKRTTTTR